jgi:hypothetical protein
MRRSLDFYNGAIERNSRAFNIEVPPLSEMNATIDASLYGALRRRITSNDASLIW